MRNFQRYQLWPATIWILCAIFAITTALYLHRLPGLFGDEASEGQNVYDLLRSDHIVTVLGERSYIGPLIDYIRVPFVWMFGYTTIALRLPMWLFSLAAFALAVPTFRKLFGEPFYVGPLLAVFFSPVYLLYQRLGWAITLFPFFAIFFLFALTRVRRPQLPLLAGFIAGVGLQNYITFFPVIIGISIPAVLSQLARTKERAALVRWWPALFGLWAGFGTQFGVMNMYQEDQGVPWEVVRSLAQRWEAFPTVLPGLVSGSAYAASYIGKYLSPTVTLAITTLIALGCILAVTLPPRRQIAWLWLGGTAIQIIGMLAMVDRFTLRYFVVFLLALWALAGFGWAKLMWLLLQKKRAALAIGTLVTAGALTGLVVVGVFVPFLRTGGGIHQFPLDAPESTAEIMVDIRPLVACIRGRGPIYSEDTHIMNRLIFLQHTNPDIELASSKKTAPLLLRHRTPATARPASNEVCPDLRHFRLFSNRLQTGEEPPKEAVR